jgi:hypothetical protein
MSKIKFVRPLYELADIFKLYLEDYLRTHKISSVQRLAVECIQKCRTALLGGHKLQCDVCGYEQIEYNSCRNRHCPKCQGSKRVQWVADRLKELLPIPYFHNVFTMPHSLNDLARYNEALIYDMFFKAASRTLHDFASDPKYLGAIPGFIGILHTWGQNLSYHVHLHFIIAGGGLSADGERWIRLPYKHKFLFPIEALSQRIRTLFARQLRCAYNNDQLVFPPDLAYLQDAANFEQFVNKIAWEEWVSYIKKPFSGPDEVIRYIGRYTHRVAISNQRILDIDDGYVTFKYNLYKDGTVTPSTTRLPADEFIRRFLCHVLPRGFKKIRHYGFLSNGCRQKSIRLIRELLDEVADMLGRAESAVDDFLERLLTCPVCKRGHLLYMDVCALPEVKPG